MRESKFTSFIAGILIGAMVVVGGSAYYLGFSLEQMSRMAKILFLIKSESLEDVANRDLIEGALRGLVGALEDPYSAYLDPREFEQLESHMEGSYGGVGIWVGLREDSRITVISPIKGSPAYREGIKAGDVIVKINDEDTVDMAMDVAVSKMKGQPGTQVTLGVSREGANEILKFTVTREQINIPSVEGKILEDHPGIAYVDLTHFSHNTAGDFARELADLERQGFKGLIIDLRNNPGGSLQAAVEVADLLVAEGPIVHIVDSRKTHVFNSTSKSINVPLVLLVNGGSASASEIVAGAVKDSGVGTLVGTRTFGKGIVQSVFELSGGTALKLTTSKYLTPHKHDIHQVGIEPHVVVEAGNEAGGLDNQLLKAIEVLQSKL